MNEIWEWWMKPRRLHGWKHAMSPDNPSALGWDVGYEAGAASEFAEQIRSCLCKCQDVTKLWILAHYFSDCLINASVNRTPTGWSKLTSHCFNNDEAKSCSERETIHQASRCMLSCDSHLLDPTSEECCGSVWIANSCFWRWEINLTNAVLWVGVKQIYVC